MPYRICKSFEVESGHMLSKHPDQCQFPHGHTRKVEFILEAEALDDREMVCDFAVIKQAVKEIVDQLDHAMCMNTKDPKFNEFKKTYGDRIIGFDDQDPTSEVMAYYFHHSLKNSLSRYQSTTFSIRDQVRLLRTRVWETSSSWAEYED